MNREYYIYWYRLDKKRAYLIWFTTDDKDGFVIDENGNIPSFESVESVLDYAQKNQINVDADNPKFFDLDIIENWLKENSDTILDYNPFLDTWNLFDDISISTDGNFDKDRTYTNNIYERIFWGCNLSPVTPDGESFTPTWTKKELKIIRETLKFGFKMFREKVNN